MMSFLVEAATHFRSSRALIVGHAMSVQPSSFLIRRPLIIRRLDRDILFAFNECYEVLFA